MTELYDLVLGMILVTDGMRLLITGAQSRLVWELHRDDAWKAMGTLRYAKTLYCHHEIGLEFYMNLFYMN